MPKKHTLLSLISYLINKSRQLILDSLFPISCIVCKKEGAWLCDICLSKIKLKKEQVCPICEKSITPDGQTCFSCYRKNKINGLNVVIDYNKNNPAIKALHLYKYRFIEDIGIPLGLIMTKSLLNSSIPIPDIIIPVPLHKRKLKWRGFNQSEILAKVIGKNIIPDFEIAIDTSSLQRVLNNTSQMKLGNINERKRNVQNIFSITNPSHIKNKTVLLVDDISTTGSTIFECAKILKKNGAKNVFGIVLARKKFGQIEN